MFFLKKKQKKKKLHNSNDNDCKINSAVYPYRNHLIVDN